MKKIFYLFTALAFSLTSCSTDEGPVGPPGPEGPQGPPGEALVGTVFDVEVDFTAEDDYSALVNYADFTDVEVFETDVVLVYLMVATEGESEGEPVPVWRLLPQTYYVEGGTMQYNYDYTFFDVNLFLDGDVDLSTLDPAFTQDQIFRIAILPAEFAQTTGVDVSNYDAVMSQLKLGEEEIPQYDLK